MLFACRSLAFERAGLGLKAPKPYKPETLNPYRVGLNGVQGFGFRVWGLGFRV